MSVAPLALATLLAGALPQPMAGEPAHPFRLPDLDGRMVSLEEMRGRIVVLHFGASW